MIGMTEPQPTAEAIPTRIKKMSRGEANAKTLSTKDSIWLIYVVNMLPSYNGAAWQIKVPLFRISVDFEPKWGRYIWSRYQDYMEPILRLYRAISRSYGASWPEQSHFWCLLLAHLGLRRLLCLGFGLLQSAHIVKHCWKCILSMFALITVVGA